MSRNARVPIYLRLSELGASQESRGTGKKERQTPLEEAIETANEDNYYGVSLSITTPEWKKRWRSLCLTSSDSGVPVAEDQAAQAEAWRASDTFKRQEVNLTKLEEAESVIGLVSEWLELDSPDEWVRLDSELALRQELAYASYLNLATVILPPPRNKEHVADYARAINGCFCNIPHILSGYLHLAIRLPLYDPMWLAAGGKPEVQTASTSTQSTSTTSTSSPAKTLRPPSASDLSEMYQTWDTIRTICGYNTRLTLALDLSYPVPPAPTLLARWDAEPVRYILIPASSFVSNTRGYPVLPKTTQNFLRNVIKHRPGFILSGTDTGLHTSGGPLAYQQYVRYIEKTSPSVIALEDQDSVETFASGYWDYLQSPLQPLMDNLQSTTYEVFERDPVKYAQYEQAVYLALCARPEDSKTIICVAGAGRGPLVARCLKAINNSGRTAMVYAVEKNPSAYVTLQERRDTEWGSLVKLVFGDMRTIDVPEKADILVSELLGSFGDNELSPECLDGASRFLKDEGISIPCSYTAFLAPLSSSRLYTEASAPPHDVKSAETPYVVMFQAVNALSTQPQECWDFEHPRKNATLDSNGLPFTNSHNARSARLTFQIPHAGVIHGLAGYFEACLYGDVGLSIHPHRKEQISPNMLSWFPLFFPLKEPIYLPSKSELDVHIWRLTDKRKVWYEWFVESFYRVPAAVGGPNGALPPQDIRLHSIAEEYTAILPPSPMVDAPSTATEGRLPGESGLSRNQEIESRIKIGQSTLHNPGGRSSWIGL